MNEHYLKTIRSFHYMLISICLVILLISLTESNRQVYNRAREQLRLLNVIEKVYSKTLVDTYNQDYYKNELLKQLTVELYQQAGKNISTQVDTSEAIYTSTINTPLLLGVDPSHLTIESLMDGLQKKQIDIILKIPDISQIAVQAIKHLTPNNKYHILQLNIKRLAGGGLLFDLHLTEEESHKSLEVQGTTEIRSGREKVPAPDIKKTMKDDVNSPFSDLDTSQFDDIMSDAIWSDIFDKTPQEAINWIEKELQQMKYILTIQGIPIPTNLAVLFGPPLTFAIMMFILGYLRQFIASYENNENSNSYLFSWIGLFDECVSRVMTITTLLIAPWLVNIILIYRRYPDLSLIEKIIGMSFTALILISSYYVLRDLSKLKEKLKSNPY